MDSGHTTSYMLRERIQAGTRIIIQNVPNFHRGNSREMLQQQGEEYTYPFPEKKEQGILLAHSNLFTKGV